MAAGSGREREAARSRGGDQLIDPMQVPRPGALTAYLEPLIQDGLDALTPGSSCVVNAYTSNYDKLHSPDLSTLESSGLHMIDAVGVVHAAILRLQAILLPVRTLVLSGGH